MTSTLRTVVRALAAAVLVAGAARAQGTTLTILSVNDTHSNLEASGPKDVNLDGTLGGLAKAAMVVAQERAAAPNPLFLHAGDLMFGDVYFNATFGVLELQVLGMLGLDAMLTGNHEYWVPPSALATVYAAAGQPFPLLAANVAADPLLPPLQPILWKDYGGVKVAILGVVTPFDVPAQKNATFLGGEDPPLGMLLWAGQKVAEVRAQGAHVVILLSHLGIALDRAIATNPLGIPGGRPDAIVGGHDHYEIAETVDGVPIVHAGAYYRQVGKLRLSIGTGGAVALSTELIPVDASVPRHPLVAAIVGQVQALVTATFPAQLDEERYGSFFHAPIATALVDVTPDVGAGLQRDTGIGNLIADAMRRKTRTDIALTANGQTPQGLYAGPIVGEDLFRTVGFGVSAHDGFSSRLVTFSISGGEILKALETTIDVSLRDNDYGLQVSGMRFTYDSRREAGHRLVSAHIGAPIDPARIYTATVNELMFGLLPALGVEIVKGSDAVSVDSEYTALRDHAVHLGELDYGPRSRIRDLAYDAP